MKQKFSLLCVILMTGLTAHTAFAKKAKVELLTLEPRILQTTLDQEHEFIAHGGTPPYTFKTSAGLIRYKDNKATYISPNRPGEAIVTVMDSTGGIKATVITVISNEQESAE